MKQFEGKNWTESCRKGWNGKKQYIQLATGISYVSTGWRNCKCEHDAIGNKAIAFVGTPVSNGMACIAGRYAC